MGEKKGAAKIKAKVDKCMQFVNWDVRGRRLAGPETGVRQKRTEKGIRGFASNLAQWPSRKAK